MKTIHAIWKNGQIVPTQPIDWPDGTTLSIEPIEEPRPDESEEDLWADDPASIARRIAFYESLPPLRMTESEEAEWQAARQELKAYTIARMRDRPIEGQP
jgi:hypothetical protein